MLDKSEQINELSLALSSLQGDLVNAVKDRSGYGYKYADLAAVLDIVRPLLKKYGLSILQPVSGSESEVEVTTILSHKSGQYISSSMKASIDNSNKKLNPLQSAGTAITYMRRYCLSSLLGISSEEDDDAATYQPGSRQPVRQQEYSMPQSTPKPIEQPAIEYTEAQTIELAEKFQKFVDDGSLSLTDVKNCCVKFGVKDPLELTAQHLDLIVKRVESKNKQ